MTTKNKTISLNHFFHAVLTVLLLTAAPIAAQEQSSLSEDPGLSNIAPEILANTVEIAIRSFEDEGFWKGRFLRDNGFIAVRNIFSLGPEAKPVLPASETDPSANRDQNILGVRIDFRRRAVASAQIIPIQPLIVEGVVKTVTVWAAGRNQNHVLKLLVKDRSGYREALYMDKLNFLGWKKLSATIPPYLKQQNYRQSSIDTGLMIEGFQVDIAIEDARGSFYLYLDDLRANTDLFSLDSADPDDPPDNW